MLGAQGCSSMQNTQDDSPSIQHYTPENPEIRAAQAELDRNAFHVRLRPIRDELWVWMTTLSDDSRSDPSHIDHSRWMAESLFVQTFDAFVEDMQIGLDRGETLWEPEMKVLDQLAQSLRRTNDLRLVPQFGNNSREARNAIRGTPITLPERTPFTFTTTTTTLIEGRTSVGALGSLFGLKGANEGSTVTQSYASDLTLISTLLGVQVIHQVQPKPGEPTFSPIRDRLGRELGIIARALTTYNLEEVLPTMAQRLVAELSPEDVHLIRGETPQSKEALLLYLDWWFRGRTDMSETEIAGAQAMWPIAREFLPGACSSLTGAGLADRYALIAQSKLVDTTSE